MFSMPLVLLASYVTASTVSSPCQHLVLAKGSEMQSFAPLDTGTW
jgi:hypothetical protein